MAFFWTMHHCISGSTWILAWAFLHEQKIIFSWFLCLRNLEALGTWIRQTVFWCKLQCMLRAPWVLGCTGFSVSVFQDSVCSLHPSLILFRHCGLRASTHSIRTLFNFGLCYFVPFSLQIHQDENIGLWLIPPWIMNDLSLRAMVD